MSFTLYNCCQSSSSKRMLKSYFNIENVGKKNVSSIIRTYFHIISASRCNSRQCFLVTEKTVGDTIYYFFLFLMAHKQ